MNRLEILVLLREIFNPTSQAVYKSDDPSGCLTDYLVDHEKLMSQLDQMIEEDGQE